MDDKEMDFYAHTNGSSDRENWQPLKEHLQNVANLAKTFAEKFNAGEWGYIAGLWHDIGKYSAEFQKRICAAGGEDAHIETIGKVDHSTAGAQHANDEIREKGFGKAIAYVIAGHHGGLPDGISTDSCLRSRLEKVIPDYNNCPQELMKSRPLTLLLKITPDRAGVQFSIFIRMLYSSLVDADFLDTEAFIDAKKSRNRQGYKLLNELEAVFFNKLGHLIKAAIPSPVNIQRELVLNQCMKASEKHMGIFSLTVPTGGGKTLSSMAFALKHAVRHGLKRIIYVIPFTSIIEQNAAVFRSMFGGDTVLEHHSNFEPENEDHRSRIAAENWDAPVVVTTNVQFFESLFANRSSRCRKLHNIVESVVILDEVQTLPAPYLLPCLETLKELAATYRVSIILCSATQPAVQKRSDFTKGLEEVTEIIADPQELAISLKRTEVSVLPQISNTELAEHIAKYEQVLCIVNTRKHARDLYKAVKPKDGLIHLSALMCPIHRSQVLEKIRQLLKNGKPCRTISTQLIEAGVDIDFPVVFRSLAGIDSVAQAAGRCNREGKLKKGKVFVFTPDSGIPAGHFRQTAQAAESVVRRHTQNILSLAAIEDYFKLYYWTKGDGLDEERILEMLNAGCQKGDFPFKTIAEKFRFIKDEMKPVVIPFDDNARQIMKSLDYCEHPLSFSRKLQRYTVSVHPNEWNKLLSMKSIEIKAEIFPVLIDETLYKNDLGLCVDDLLHRDPEDLYK
ncbi:MAG: CRISPR-associated helicase Cas3' [Syntrophaceae bacterium]|nr:CRISPR-associated helicase Cas3' [Syntrophaceae bacterium]